MSYGLIMRQRPLPETRTPDNSCAWLAETEIDRQLFEAKSRRGATNALARALVAAGVPDQPVSVTHQGLRGEMRYPSLHQMAGVTNVEGIHTLLRQVPYREFPEGAALPSECPVLRIGEGQNGGISRSDVSLVIPEPEPAFCTGCGKEFAPSRRWATFCSAACKQKAYRARRCGPGSGMAVRAEMRNAQQPAP
jgi:hypothetical protein